MAVYIKCPRCKTIWDLHRCSNCGSEDGFFIKVIKLGYDVNDNPCAFCKECGLCPESYHCQCGCQLSCTKLSESEPIFGRNAKTSINGKVNIFIDFDS